MAYVSPTALRLNDHHFRHILDSATFLTWFPGPFYAFIAEWGATRPAKAGIPALQS